MTIVNEKAAARGLAFNARILAVLVAALECARRPLEAGGLRDVTMNDEGGFDLHVVAEEGKEPTPEPECVRDLRDALDSLERATASLIVDSRNLDMIAALFPTAIDQAALAMLGAEADFEHTTKVYIERLAEWQTMDALTGRTRQRCVKLLVEGGMAPTPADKAASDHPDYTEHKDRCLELAMAKDEAEAERDVAKMRATNARELLRAMVSAPSFFIRTAEQRKAIDMAVASRTIEDAPQPPASA